MEDDVKQSSTDRYALSQAYRWRAERDQARQELREIQARLMPEGMEWPRYEDGEPVRIGDVVSDVEVRSVVFRDGGILLSDCTSVPGWGTWRSYKEPLKTGGWSLKGEHETLARLSLEEFMASEWWEPYIEKTKYQNFDSSWMDSFNVDADEDHAEINFECPEFKKVWWCSSEVPSGRIAKCRVYVGSDGILYLKVKNEGEEANIIEFIEAFRRLRELERAGVSLDDEGNVIVRKTAERGE